MITEHFDVIAGTLTRKRRLSRAWSVTLAVSAASHRACPGNITVQTPESDLERQVVSQQWLDTAGPAMVRRYANRGLRY